MSAYLMEAPIELTDDQLDIIAAGARQPKQEGLVNVNVEDEGVPLERRMRVTLSAFC
jgi:hypothetical protein